MDTLHLSIKRVKEPKNIVAKWLFWKIWFPVWYIWRRKMMASIYKFFTMIIFLFLPKAEKEQLINEFKSLKIVVKKDEN